MSIILTMLAFALVSFPFIIAYKIAGMIGIYFVIGIIIFNIVALTVGYRIENGRNI